MCAYKNNDTGISSLLNTNNSVYMKVGCGEIRKTALDTHTILYVLIALLLQDHVIKMILEHFRPSNT